MRAAEGDIEAWGSREGTKKAGDGSRGSRSRRSDQPGLQIGERQGRVGDLGARRTHHGDDGLNHFWRHDGGWLVTVAVDARPHSLVLRAIHVAERLEGDHLDFACRRVEADAAVKGGRQDHQRQHADGQKTAQSAPCP